MKEFDLIPDNYRTYISKLYITKLSVLVLIFFLIVSGIAFAGIEVAKKAASKKIDELKLTNEVTQQEQAKFNELQQLKQELENKWNLLNGLRSTPPPENILAAIDEALVDVNVWFTNLRFDRIEKMLPKNSTGDAGNFIIIGKDENNSLSIGTKMIISGGAENHSTLSVFVKHLLTQDIVLDAKVLETSTTNNSRYIDYVVEIVVNLKAVSQL